MADSKNGGKLAKKPKGSGKKVREFFAGFRDAIAGVASADRPTRRRSWVFIASLVGLASVGTYWVLHSRGVQDMRRAMQEQNEKESQRISEFLQRQAEDARLRYTHQPIGTFTIELNPPEGAVRQHTVTYLAEVDLTVQCDLRRTCIFVEEHETEVRNQVVSALGSWNRDELLSLEGKRRLKAQIIQRVNQWLPAGKLTDVFISRLIAN